MPDISNENKKYFSAVLQSVADLHKTETEIENDKGLLAKFTDFLAKNAEEIGKFHAIENEIVEFLQKFSFVGNADVTLVKEILTPLPPIRQKLVQMGEEAKKLVGFSDRYNCHKAMDVCKNLAMFCINEMKSADYKKVETAINQNIPKLQNIQQAFAKENKIIVDLTVELEKLSAQIKNYADRYQKNSIFSNAIQLLSSVKQKVFNSFDNTQAEFRQNISAVKNLIIAFDKEKKETVALCNILKQKLPDLWMEDNEQLIAELDAIIKKGTETSNFVLQNFHSHVQTATNKRTQDISATEQKYKWLRRNRYVVDLNRLKNRHISFSSFQLEIERIRKSRGLFTKFFEWIFYRNN